MCGFLGLINFNGNLIEDNKLVLSHNLKRRGPDSYKRFKNEFSVVEFYRLAINAIKTGEQPFYDEHNKILVVFNGEIYNYKLLIDDLSGLGCNIVTNSEVEIISKCYLMYEEKCFEKFIGMWSITIVDFNKRRVLLSVDRFSEKPLFYGVDKDTLFFSSLIKPILQNGFPKELRYELIELYLFLQFIPNPNTFYKNLYKVEPGTVVLMDESLNKKIYKYFELPKIKESDLINDEKYVINYLKNIIYENMEIYKTSEVPISLFLSGGVDSGSLAALFTKKFKTEFECFNVIDNGSYNEKDRVKYLEKKLNLKVNYIYNYNGLENNNFRLEDIFEVFGEPFADSSSINIYIMTKLIKDKYKVAIAGDGGDELFSGYNSYLSILLEERIKKLPFFLKNNIPYIIDLIKRDSRYKFTDISNLKFSDKIIIKRALENYKSIKKQALIFGPQISIEEYIYEFFNEYNHLDDFYKLIYFDYKVILPNDYLVKVDRMSADNSVEVRNPFLNHKLVEFMIQVSKEIKWKRYTKKYPLIKIMQDYIPKKYLLLPKKGFGITLKNYLDKYNIYNYRFDLLNELKFDEMNINKHRMEFIYQLLSLNNFID